MTLLPFILLLISATGFLAVWLGMGRRHVASLCICLGIAAMLSAAGCQDKADEASETGDDQEGQGDPDNQGKQGTAQVQAARLAYDQSLARLKENSLSPQHLNAALRAGDADQLAKLAGGNEKLLAQLQELQEAYGSRIEARKRYVEARIAWNQAKDTVPLDQQATHPAYKKFRDEQSFYYNDQLPAFDAQFDKLLDEHGGQVKAFRFIQEIPAEDTEARATWLKELKRKHPGQAEAIEQAYEALLAYERAQDSQVPGEMPGEPSVEFRIAVSPAKPEAFEQEIKRFDAEGPQQDSKSIYRWYEVDDLKQYVDDAERRAQVQKWLAQSLSLSVQDQKQARDAVYQQFSPTFGQTHGVVAQPYAGRLFLLLHNERGLAMTDDNGWAITSAKRRMGELGRPVVSFSLDGNGAALMRDMTRSSIDRPMAVLLNDKVLTTPGIRGELGGQIEISGDFSEAEIAYLLRAFNSQHAGRAP